jgi:hypothetical protein
MAEFISTRNPRLTGPVFGTPVQDQLQRLRDLLDRLMELGLCRVLGLHVIHECREILGHMS